MASHRRIVERAKSHLITRVVIATDVLPKNRNIQKLHEILNLNGNLCVS